MQPRLFIAAIIYLASYLPLSVILLCQDLNFEGCEPSGRAWWVRHLPVLDHPVKALGAVLVCILALVVALLVLRLTKPKRQIIIKDSKHVPADLMNYSLPYIVSLIGLDYKDTGKLLGFFVFLFWIFIITHRSGSIILNPVLTVFGWRLYEVDYSFQGGTETYAGVTLSRVSLLPGRAYRQSTMQDVLIVKGDGDAI